jgi:hypothetical protein
MLTIYTTRTDPPPDALSFADTHLDVLVETLQTVLTHRSATKIWLGYLEGWMLTPIEETNLRNVLRSLDCFLVCQYPHSFSHAWKNETQVIHGLLPTNGYSETYNDGSSI